MEEDHSIVGTLRSVGEAPLTRARLAKALGVRPAGLDALRRSLARLEQEGTVLNLGTEKSPRYLLPEFDRRRDRACDTILGRATPGKATVFNAAALRRGHAKGCKRPLIEEAIAALVAWGELFIIQPGKSVYYLHARSIAPLLGAAAAAVRVFQPRAVREAYAGLVREGGFADVPIHHLAQRSGAPLADLKAWLLAESRAGRAAPTRGDWSLADSAARAAAVEVRGEPHLQIRLL